MKDKFIVACNAKGNLEVWELQLALQSSSDEISSMDSVNLSSECLLIDNFPIPNLEKLDFVIAADEFQIVICVQNAITREDWLNVLDFVHGNGSGSGTPRYTTKAGRNIIPILQIDTSKMPNFSCWS